MLRSSLKLLVPLFSVVIFSGGLSGAQAQVGIESKWTIADGDLSIHVSRTSHYPRANWRTGQGAAPAGTGGNGFLEMQGEYRNLRWQGEYWVMGASSWRPRSSCVGLRPNGYTEGDNAYDYGDFDVTFNAAENSFSGQKRWKCRYADGRTRHGPWEAFSGTRKNTFFAVPPTKEVPVSTPDTGAPPAESSRDRRVLEPPRPNPQGDCAGLDRIVLGFPEGAVELRRNYGIRPCTIDALAQETFQIDFRDPIGKRPEVLVLRAFRRTGSLYRKEGTRQVVMPAQRMGTRMIQSLPFMGDPARGSVWRNLKLNAAFCQAVYWLVHVKFSDGTESEPFNILVSECGARLHPEQVFDDPVPPVLFTD